jgi:raffinose/stachyose/melibiose transport system substrate-binding protein
VSITGSRWRRTRACQAALVGLTLAALAACGSGSGTSSTSSGDALAVPQPGSAEAQTVKGTVNWWGWSPGVSVAPVYVKAFNEAYPNIKVNFKFYDYNQYSPALRTGVGSPSGPDVFDLEPGGIAKQYGRFGTDLTPLAQKVLGSDWKSKLSPLGPDAFTQDGKLKALSVGSGGAGTLVINKTLFDRWGLKPPTTLDEWVSACKTIKAKGKTCFVHGAKDAWVNRDLIQAIANSIAPGKFAKAVQGQAKWTDPDLVQALSVYRSLFGNGVMQPGAAGITQYNDAQNKFMAQDAAMIMQGTWELGNYKTQAQTAGIKSAGVSSPKPFVEQLVPFPDVAGKGNKPYLFGDPDFGLTVNARSKNQRAANIFVAWYTLTKQGQQVVADQYTQVPSLKGIAPATQGLVDPSVQVSSLRNLGTQVQSATEHRQVAYPDLMTAIGDAASALASGSKTPQAAAQDLQTASDGVAR